jgi:hypothetical protein
MLFLNSCSSHEEGELLPKDTPYSVVNVQLLKLDISPQDLSDMILALICPLLLLILLYFAFPVYFNLLNRVSRGYCVYYVALSFK